MNGYFFHSIMGQLQSIKSMLLYLIPRASPDRAVLLERYENMAEDIASMIAEINEINTEDEKR